MTLLDIAEAVRRQWLLAVAVLAVTLAVAVLVIVSTPRSYVATATVGIVPGSAAADLDSFGQLPNVAPLYAELARSEPVRSRTRDLVEGEVGVTSVRVFRDTPLILKLDATAGSAGSARDTAAAFVRALQAEARTGAVAPASQVAVKLFGAPAAPGSAVAPRVNVILFAGMLAGLVLAVVAAVLRDAPAGSHRVAPRVPDAPGRQTGRP